MILLKNRRHAYRLPFFILPVILLLFSPGTSLSKTVSLPLSIDYPLLTSLVLKETFTDPNRTAVLLDESEGCRRIVLSEPSFRERDCYVMLETKVYIRMGLTPFDLCLFPVEWEGYVVLKVRPKITQQWVLSFETVDSMVLNKNRKPVSKITSMIWEHIKTTVYNYLGDIAIDLKPPVADLKAFLRPLFPPDQQAQAENMMNSMRAGDVITSPDSIQIPILTEVEDTHEQEEAWEEEEMIPEEQLAGFIDAWEAWDAFLVHEITSLSNEPLTLDERQVLLDILLDIRYEFVQNLMEQSHEKDFVRQQFVHAWKRMSPVFRRHLSDDPSRSLLSYLAFFTASDALTALDEIGPTLGIEISRDGLMRLASLASEGRPVTLDYLPGVNVDLRMLLGFGGPLEVSGPPFDHMSSGTRLSKAYRALKGLWDLSPARSWADTKGETGSIENPGEWIMDPSEPITYVERILGLLKETSAAISGKIHSVDDTFFRTLVLSSAWQESCFRQFESNAGKINYIRSYNGTSVGLMQINERVWRGMYDEKALRWNIRYNAKAGCEILDLYLRRYALKHFSKTKNKENPDETLLARAVYAMYTAGPGQLQKFLRRHGQKKYSLIDRLFFEKYVWVTKDEWNKILICLTGEENNGS